MLYNSSYGGFLTMLNIKLFAATGSPAILVVSLPACGKDKSSGYTPLPEEDDTVYNISLCQDEDSDYYNNISQGFNDALTDLFGSVMSMSRPWFAQRYDRHGQHLRRLCHRRHRPDLCQWQKEPVFRCHGNRGHSDRRRCCYGLPECPSLSHRL